MLSENDLKNEIEKQLENCEFKEKGKILNVKKIKILNLEIDKSRSTEECLVFRGKFNLFIGCKDDFLENTYDYFGRAYVKENITVSIPEYISVSKPNSLG